MDTLDQQAAKVLKLHKAAKAAESAYKVALQELAKAAGLPSQKKVLGKYTIHRVNRASVAYAQLVKDKLPHCNLFPYTSNSHYYQVKVTK